MPFVPPKDPIEKEYFSFEFAALLGVGETIMSGSAVWSIVVLKGADPASESMLSGTPVYQGSKILHLIADGVNGVLYCISCKITTSADQELRLSDTVWVRNQCA